MKLGNTEVLRHFQNPDFVMASIILYTDRNPFIKKVLRDEDFWESLDEVSNSDIAVFSIRPNLGSFSSKRNSGGAFDWMVPVWSEPSENLELMKVLGLGDSRDLPCVVVLFSRSDGLGKALFEIEETDENGTFRELERVLGALGKVAKRIRDSPRESNVRVESEFKALELRCKTYCVLRKGLGLYRWFKDLAP